MIVRRRDKGLVVLASFLVTAVICVFVTGCRRDPVDYYNRGCAYHAEGQHELAISEFTNVIEIDPEFVEAYLNRGNAYSELGRYDQAIADFTKTIEMVPEFADAYVDRGVCYANKGEYDRAIADFNETIKIHPDFGRAYVNRGCVYHDKGEYDKAISDCTKAIEMYPKYAVGYVNRGSAYKAQGDYDLAISDFTKALEIDRSFVEARRGRIAAYRARGEYERAIADCNEFIQIAPGRPEAYNSLAWLLASCPDEKCRDGRRAVENATRACELSDWTNANHLDTLAAAHAEAGQFEEAVKWQTRAMELAAPEYDRTAWQSRLQLYRAGTPYREEASCWSPWAPVEVNAIGIGPLSPAP